MVPVLALFVDAAVRAGRVQRWVLWAAACAVAAVYFDWPGAVPGAGPMVPRGLLPLVYGPGEHPYGQLYHWHGSEVILGNAYVLGGVVLFTALIAAALRRWPSRAVPPPGSGMADPLPAPVQPATGPELVRG
jgi:hypothetical protein